MNKLLCPDFAIQMAERMPERGRYAQGGPLGAVVHYTAGRDGAEKTIKGGIKDGFTYWCIQRDGKLYCAHNADKWGYHAGQSNWQKYVPMMKGGVNDDLIGIEINAAGTVKPHATKKGVFVTYWGEELAASDVRYTPGRDNQAKGFYHKYTPAQEETLVRTLLWLAKTFPKTFSFDRVLGHDEVSGVKGIGYFRKVDPGAALSMTMSEFREKLKVMRIKEFASENM